MDFQLWDTSGSSTFLPSVTCYRLLRLTRPSPCNCFKILPKLRTLSVTSSSSLPTRREREWSRTSKLNLLKHAKDLEKIIIIRPPSTICKHIKAEFVSFSHVIFVWFYAWIAIPSFSFKQIKLGQHSFPNPMKIKQVFFLTSQIQTFKTK